MSSATETIDNQIILDNLADITDNDTFNEIEQAISPEYDAAQATSVPVQDASGLVAKTFFLRVRYGSIGNSRQVSGANVLSTDADVSLLNVSKTLLESPELEAIRKHDTKLRKWLGNMCLPFLDWPGVLVLPKGLVKVTQAKLIEHKAERTTLIVNFIETYPARVEAAKAALGTLFNSTEYPDVSEVAERFVFDWAYKSFDTPDALKEVDAELYQQQVEQQQAQFTAATEEITAVMREALYEMVNHLKERLTPTPDGKNKILKESAINNLKEFLDNFDLRNVTNDKALAIEVQKVRSLLGGTTAASLRTSDEWREKILKGMSNVTESLGTMVETKSGRKFRAE